MKLKVLLAEKRREALLFNELVTNCMCPFLASFVVDAIFFMVHTWKSPSFLVIDIWLP